MAPRQSITSLALQVSNSAKKRQGPVSQRRAEETTQSGRPVQGTLRFIDQSSSSRHSASDPIEIEDDSQPVQGTASSWEKDQYYFGEHDPYDETFKPPERDSQDETMVYETSKTRQQPPRIATTRKQAHVIPNAMFEEDLGILTPPPTNLRQMRKGTAKESSKGKDKVRSFRLCCGIVRIRTCLAALGNAHHIGSCRDTSTWTITSTESFSDSTYKPKLGTIRGCPKHRPEAVVNASYTSINVERKRISKYQGG